MLPHVAKAEEQMVEVEAGTNEKPPAADAKDCSSSICAGLDGICPRRAKRAFGRIFLGARNLPDQLMGCSGLCALDRIKLNTST
jgi:hypothetical protein